MPFHGVLDNVWVSDYFHSEKGGQAIYYIQKYEIIQISIVLPPLLDHLALTI